MECEANETERERERERKRDLRSLSAQNRSEMKTNDPGYTTPGEGLSNQRQRLSKRVSGYSFYFWEVTLPGQG